MTKTVYPPDWNFTEETDPRKFVIGDMYPIAMPAPPLPSRCPNCYDHELLYARKLTARRRIVTWHGDVRLHAELISAPCPVCQGDALDEWLEAHCGLAGLELDGKPALDIRVTDVKPLPGQEESFGLAWKLAAQLPEARTWALFSGDFGRGKTHLLCGLVNACRMARVYAIYTKSERILAALRATYDPGALESTEEVRRRFEHVPVLVIDELDRVKWTEWAGEQLFAILDARYTHGRATWFASNLGPLVLAKENRSLGALVSRISSGEVALVQGPDLRPTVQEPLPDPELPDRFID